MKTLRLPVQVKSGCNASSEIMRSEAIPLELFGQSEDTFNASSTAFAGHFACAAGEPFDSCVNCPFHLAEQNVCDISVRFFPLFLHMTMEKAIGYTMQMRLPRAQEQALTVETLSVKETWCGTRSETVHKKQPR